MQVKDEVARGCVVPHLMLMPAVVQGLTHRLWAGSSAPGASSMVGGTGRGEEGGDWQMQRLHFRTRLCWRQPADVVPSQACMPASGCTRRHKAFADAALQGPSISSAGDWYSRATPPTLLTPHQMA